MPGTSLSLRHLRILLRRHGPEALIWRRRIAILGGAVLTGLAALLFARLADEASEMFVGLARRWPAANISKP